MARVAFSKSLSVIQPWQKKTFPSLRVKSHLMWKLKKVVYILFGMWTKHERGRKVVVGKQFFMMSDGPFKKLCHRKHSQCFNECTTYSAPYLITQPLHQSKCRNFWHYFSYCVCNFLHLLALNKNQESFLFCATFVVNVKRQESNLEIFKGGSKDSLCSLKMWFEHCLWSLQQSWFLNLDV